MPYIAHINLEKNYLQYHHVFAMDYTRRIWKFPREGSIKGFYGFEKKCSKLHPLDQPLTGKWSLAKSLHWTLSRKCPCPESLDSTLVFLTFQKPSLDLYSWGTRKFLVSPLFLPRQQMALVFQRATSFH